MYVRVFYTRVLERVNACVCVRVRVSRSISCLPVHLPFVDFDPWRGTNADASLSTGRTYRPHAVIGPRCFGITRGTRRGRASARRSAGLLSAGRGRAIESSGRSTDGTKEKKKEKQKKKTIIRYDHDSTLRDDNITILRSTARARLSSDPIARK